MQQAYIELNGVRTSVVTYGRWIEESKKDGDSDDIVVIIPGNPGVTGFYHLFAKTMHDRLGYPVWIVGHAGHNIPDNSRIQIPKFEDHKDLYGLKGQIDHKVDFFNKYIPENSKVHLIGHSIGAYMILDILEHPLIQNKVKHAYMLFPTIEYMEETKIGKKLVKYVNDPLASFLVCIVRLLTVLPSLVLKFMLYVYLILKGISAKDHFDHIKALLKPGVIRRSLFLASEEMKQVKERNSEAIRKNVGKIKFYYSDSDAWTPPSYIDSLRNSIKDVDVECTSLFSHAFVLKNSIDVGNCVSDWIQERH